MVNSWNRPTRTTMGYGTQHQLSRSIVQPTSGGGSDQRDGPAREGVHCCSSALAFDASPALAVPFASLLTLPPSRPTINHQPSTIDHQPSTINSTLTRTPTSSPTGRPSAPGRP